MNNGLFFKQNRWVNNKILTSLWNYSHYYAFNLTSSEHYTWCQLVIINQNVQSRTWFIFNNKNGVTTFWNA